MNWHWLLYTGLPGLLFIVVAAISLRLVITNIQRVPQQHQGRVAVLALAVGMLLLLLASFVSKLFGWLAFVVLIIGGVIVLGWLYNRSSGIGAGPFDPNLRREYQRNIITMFVMFITFIVLVGVGMFSTGRLWLSVLVASVIQGVVIALMNEMAKGNFVFTRVIEPSCVIVRRHGGVRTALPQLRGRVLSQDGEITPSLYEHPNVPPLPDDPFARFVSTFDWGGFRYLGVPGIDERAPYPFKRMALQRVEGPNGGYRVSWSEVELTAVPLAIQSHPMLLKASEVDELMGVDAVFTVFLVATNPIKTLTNSEDGLRLTMQTIAPFLRAMIAKEKIEDIFKNRMEFNQTLRTALAEGTRIPEVQEIHQRFGWWVIGIELSEIDPTKATISELLEAPWAADREASRIAKLAVGEQQRVEKVWGEMAKHPALAHMLRQAEALERAAKDAKGATVLALPTEGLTGANLALLGAEAARRGGGGAEGAGQRDSGGTPGGGQRGGGGAEGGSQRGGGPRPRE